MIKTFLNSIERAKNQINNSIFMFAYRKKSNYFTRNTAKMGFSDAICFILKGIKRTLQIELDNWFEFLDSGNQGQQKQSNPVEDNDFFGGDFTENTNGSIPF